MVANKTKEELYREIDSKEAKIRELESKLSNFNDDIKYKSIFEKSPDASLLVEDNIIIDCNESAISMFGYSSRKELIGLEVYTLSPRFQPDGMTSSKKGKGLIANAIENKRIVFEWIHSRKNGELFPVEVVLVLLPLENGKRIINASLRDITERKAHERVLMESEERLRTLVDILPDGVFIKIDKKVQFANKSALRFLGLDNPKDIFGKRDEELITVHPDDYNKSIKLRKEYLKTGKSSFTDMKLIRKSDDNVIEVERGIILVNYGGRLAELVIWRDISYKKRAEKYVKLFNEAMEYNQLKTQFFANLSHELRTPLNLILGIIQILEIDYRDNTIIDSKNKFDKRLKSLKQNCFRLLRLISNLIDITKMESGYLELNLGNYNIVNIVEDITLSVVQYLENKDISLIFDTDIEEKIIACDPDKIERIMLNLLSNAIKFTKDKGKIEVDIKDRDDKVLISVKDSGMGIPKDKIDDIFKQFRQVDKSFTRNHEGSGIGLSLVKSLVELHGGNITVKSKYREGSEFIIEFPVRLLDKDKSKDEDISSNNNRDYVETINIEFSDIYS